MPDIDSSFLALPAHALAEVAPHRAQELGVAHADFRLERIRTGSIRLRDPHLDSLSDTEDVGLSVRVVHDGTWGFASGFVRSLVAARALAEWSDYFQRTAMPALRIPDFNMSTVSEAS